MPFNTYIKFISNRICLSYILDWVIVIVFLGIGGSLTYVEPIKRDFSLTDKTISFPYRKDTISTSVLIIVAVVAPGVIVALVSLLFTRLPTRSNSQPIVGSLWKRKLWEWHAGWLGLALSITLSFLLTQTMKNMFGKHRPDFLARCDPDVANMSKYVVGGFTSEILEGTSQLVEWQICNSKNGTGLGTSVFLDGFRSFPSGHCTSMYILTSSLKPRTKLL
jgi:membrane-associated phospholipid phosphatase